MAGAIRNWTPPCAPAVPRCSRFAFTSTACRRTTAPLREAARRLAEGEADVALFTTAVQIEHLARVAREAGMEEQALAGLRRCRVGSIGTTTTEALEQFGIHPDLEPSPPKMGLLVREAADYTPAKLWLWVREKSRFR